MTRITYTGVGCFRRTILLIRSQHCSCDCEQIRTITYTRSPSTCVPCATYYRHPICTIHHQQWTRQAS